MKKTSALESNRDPAPIVLASPGSGFTALLSLLFIVCDSAFAAPPPNTTGQLIAFTAAGLDGNGFGGIWLVQPNGTGFRQLTSFANPIFELDDLHGLQLPEDHAAISPDGKKIAFVSNRGHAFNKELYLMDVNGANVRRLTVSDGLDTEPSWSPDGKRLAFSTARFGNMDLAILDLATLNVTRLTTHPAEDVEPAWSPDGNRIAFTRSFAKGVFAVYMIDTNGANEHLVFDRFGEDHDASWNPDSTRLTITSNDDVSVPYGDVFVINADGSNPVDLTTDYVFGAADPSWSPDGTKIAFFHSNFPILKSPQHLYVMNANGTGKFEFEEQGFLNLHPHFGWMVDTDQDGRPDYLENANTHFTGRSFGNVTAGAMFGHALAVGELLPAPGWHTLAMGIPGTGSGRVITRHFTPEGFKFNIFVVANGDPQPGGGFDPTFWGVTAPTGARFGQTIVAGDFDGNGFKEIAIGAPGMGRVFILDSAARPKRVLTGGVAGFGSALAVGDFNNDGRDDLAVGSPNETRAGQANAGAVYVFFGSASGLPATAGQSFDQGSLPVGDVGGVEANDNFGAALAAGDLTGDSADDLIVAVPGESYSGASAAGMVHIIPGTNGATLRLSAAAQRDARSFPAPFTGAQSGARFGEALALGKFGGLLALAKQGLVVGVPSQNIGGVADAGLVAIYSSGGTSLPTNATLVFCRTNLPASSGLQSIRFGQTLCAADFSEDGLIDLAVAAPRAVGGSSSEAGSVFIIHGNPAESITIGGGLSCSLCAPMNPITLDTSLLAAGGLSLAGAQRLDLGQFGGTPAAQDHFGANLQFGSPNALTAFDFDSDGQKDLFIGVPEANADGETDAGLFAIRFGLKVGVFTLTPSNAVVDPGQPITLELNWTHPNLWTDLDSVQLRLAAAEGVFFWLRFDETTHTVSLFDPAADDFSAGIAFGSAGVLSNLWASVDLAQSQLITSGPEGAKITMRLRLTLSRAAACRRFAVQLFATDDHGNSQGFDHAGTLSCGDCFPRVVNGQLQFGFPTESGQSYTVESLEVLGSDTWAAQASVPGDGNIYLFRDDVVGPQRLYRVRSP